MQRPILPITALPAWSKLNDVNFLDVNVQDLGSEKGYGLVTFRALNSEDVFDVPTLLIIPHDLILSAEAVEEHAKVDPHFKQLLEVFGGKVGAKRTNLMHHANELLVHERRRDVVSFDADHNCVKF